jgi:tetratricopeptide (TPR) repeat protein
MKALIINSQGNTEEAFALAKFALKNSMKSHVCWHVYGLLYRSAKNFEEAIKAYKFALKLEPDSQQIQKDLALLQMQMRDYPGYVQSRTAILRQRTGWRQNWTALAVAQHLAGNLDEAEITLTTYEETLRGVPPKTDIEHSEAVLYKNSIIAEMGETERALDHLNAAAKNNPDRTSVMELRAQYLLTLVRKEEAAKAYRALLDRNPEYRPYYQGLQSALGFDKSDTKALKELYGDYAKQNPRGDAARRIPLDFLEGDDFREAVDQYLQHMLHKGVPSTFANVKALYPDTRKRNTIQETVEGYAAGNATLIPNGSAEKQENGDSQKPDLFAPSVRYFLAQHYIYQLSRDLTKAMKYIEEAIESSPESVDYHMTKARILKYHGSTQKAAETMEQARTLDSRDRYINTKAAKYHLRNDDNEAAIQNMSKFTRNEAVGGPLGDLHDMQCVWYLVEDGESYIRQGKLGLALKRFNSISSIFEIWQEDQFDFHSFSLRKGQIRAYVEMIRWEDHLREHPFFSRAAINAARIYIMLYDDPNLAHGPLANGVNGENMDSAERKKAEKKARKEKEKQEKAEVEKKDAKKPAPVDSNGEPKKEDKDPKGEKLLQTSEPLVEAMKSVAPLLEFSPRNIEAQQVGFEVFIRRSKYSCHQKSIYDYE